MRFGIMHFGRAPFTDLVRRVQIEEALGFDHGWVDDDLNLPSFADFEPWSLLAALARETTRIRLGTLVSVPPFRHPSLLAAQITTVDHVSGGRVEVGIGAGGPHNQYTAYGSESWSAKERMDRLSEQVAILDGLLRGETVTTTGPYYPVTDAKVSRPVQQPRPPLIIAAHGLRGLRLTAEIADGWNSLGGQPYPDDEDPARRVSLREAVAETKRLSDLLNQACEAIGRDPQVIRRMVLAHRPVPDPFASSDAFDEYVGAYREIGINEIIFYWPTLDHGKGELVPPEDQARFERIAADRLLVYHS